MEVMPFCNVIFCKMLDKLHGLDSFLIYWYTFIKYRSTSIWGEIHQLLRELSPFFKFFLSQDGPLVGVSVPYWHISSFILFIYFFFFFWSWSYLKPNKNFYNLWCTIIEPILVPVYTGSYKAGDTCMYSTCSECFKLFNVSPAEEPGFWAIWPMKV